MWFLVLQAYCELIRFDAYLVRGNFPSLYAKVHDQGVQRSARARSTTHDICSAVDMACIWYWKQALCLQRSAATACLLKKHGVTAQMVIGVQRLPFKAHAWVEVDGRVVNDKSYTAELYNEIDRC